MEEICINPVSACRIGKSSVLLLVLLFLFSFLSNLINLFYPTPGFLHDRYEFCHTLSVMAFFTILYLIPWSIIMLRVVSSFQDKKIATLFYLNFVCQVMGVASMYFCPFFLSSFLIVCTIYYCIYLVGLFSILLVAYRCIKHGDQNVKKFGRYLLWSVLINLLFWITIIPICFILPASWWLLAILIMLLPSIIEILPVIIFFKMIREIGNNM